MKKTVHKVFWLWQYEKEEEWLNEMAAEGFALCGVGFCRYDFEEAQPGEWEVCLQYLEQGDPERERYLRFVEETGAEYVGHMLKWVYFRKKRTEDGERFTLFSDRSSRILYLTSLIRFTTIVGGANLLVGLSNVRLYFTSADRTGLSLLGLVNIALGVFCLLAGTVRLVKRRKKLREEENLYE